MRKTNDRTELTNEIFNANKNDIKFIKAVKNAHGWSKGHGMPTEETKLALCYPITYLVTKEQINEAQNIYLKLKDDFIKNLEPKTIVFTGMGSDLIDQEGEQINHRLRAEFLNDEGKHFFIEFTKAIEGRENKFHVPHAVDRDLEREYNAQFDYYNKQYNELRKQGKRDQEIEKQRAKFLKQPYYNYKDLERDQKKLIGDFTTRNLLKFINKNFKCSYKKLIVDNHFLRAEEYLNKP